MRLADLAIGGIDNVTYHVCQIYRLLDSGLKNVLVKWRRVDCPYYKLRLASTRKIDSRKLLLPERLIAEKVTGDWSGESEGLNDDDL